MICHKIVNSVFNSCTYVLHKEGAKEAVIIDCGDYKPIIDYLTTNKLNLVAILLTHTHFDHIYGILKIVEVYPMAYIYTSENGVIGLNNSKYNLSRYQNDMPDFIFESNSVLELEDGSEIDLAGMHFNVISTEGHDWSCLSYIVENLVFTGDSYIPGINVVDTWPKSNKQKSKSSLIKLKLLESNGLTIMGGHEIER